MSDNRCPFRDIVKPGLSTFFSSMKFGVPSPVTLVKKEIKKLILPCSNIALNTHWVPTFDCGKTCWK